MRVGHERSSHGGGCALCGGPRRHKSVAAPAGTCACGKAICAAHAYYVDGVLTCSSCVRRLELAVRRRAIPAG